MPVELRSPKEKVMFEGEYDPMVAEENEATWWVKCDNCGKEEQGTTFELHEKFSFSFTIDTETIEIRESEAECQECTGEKTEEDTEAWKTAQNDPAQKTLGDES